MTTCKSRFGDGDGVTALTNHDVDVDVDVDVEYVTGHRGYGVMESRLVSK